MYVESGDNQIKGKQPVSFFYKVTCTGAYAIKALWLCSKIFMNIQWQRLLFLASDIFYQRLDQFSPFKKSLALQSLLLDQSPALQLLNNLPSISLYFSSDNHSNNFQSVDLPKKNNIKYRQTLQSPMSLPNRHNNYSNYINPGLKIKIHNSMAARPTNLLRFKLDHSQEKPRKQHPTHHNSNRLKDKYHHLKTDGDARQNTFEDEDEQRVLAIDSQATGGNKKLIHRQHSVQSQIHKHPNNNNHILQPSSTKNSSSYDKSNPDKTHNKSKSIIFKKDAYLDVPSAPNTSQNFKQNYGSSIRNIKQHLQSKNSQTGLFNPYLAAHLSLKQSKKHSLKDELLNHSVGLYTNPSLHHTRKGSLHNNNNNHNSSSNQKNSKHNHSSSYSNNHQHQSPFKGNSKKPDGRGSIFLDQQKNKRLNPYMKNAMGRRGSQASHSRSQQRSKQRSSYLKTQESVMSSQQQKRNVIHKPMRSKEVLTLHLSSLSKYEQAEILEYDNVYYLNKKGYKEKGGEENNGFDDKKGQYLCSMNDHIAYRYQLLEELGKGSFGQVFKAFDHKTKEVVALKIIRNKKTPNSQARIEYALLKYLKDVDEYSCVNIVRVKECFNFRKHYVRTIYFKFSINLFLLKCMTFEMLSHNLYELIKLNKFLPLSGELVRRISIQILSTLLFLSKHNIIHCDIKPENILLKNSQKSGIKLIDFGSSCFADQKLYTYIQSRYYRAPEVILGYDYDTQIDMWSFGCVSAELKLSYPIFSGQDQDEQIALITEVIGRPEREFYQATQRGQQHFGRNAEPLKDRDGMIIEDGSRKLTNLFSDPDFADFLSKVFVWDPRKRMTPLDALRHKWVLKGLPEEIREQHLQFLKEEEVSLREIIRKRAQNSKLLRQTKGAHSMSEELLSKAMQSLS